MTLGQSWNPFAQTDQLSRLLGEYLDAAGVGPQETAYERVDVEVGLSLRRYVPNRGNGPVVLIVPAPIKGPYIWDAAPNISVVQRLMEGDCRVYVVEWARPDARLHALGLSDYADRLLLKGLDCVQAETGRQSVFLAGHSLGGTFAALCAALHPPRIKGLILVGAPLHFGPWVGPLDRLVAASPPASVVTASMDTVPGSLLGVFARAAAPEGFIGYRWLDGLISLSDPEALKTHLRVVRWSLDEAPLPKRLFEEVVEALYRENRFMGGDLRLDGKPATPDQVTAPLLSVVDAHGDVVPPQAVLPFHRAVGGPDKELLWYGGDAGVALRHVGALVGRSAHQTLWPQIVRWIHARD